MTYSVNGENNIIIVVFLKSYFGICQIDHEVKLFYEINKVIIFIYFLNIQENKNKLIIINN
jgi:hypothetical protein